MRYLSAEQLMGSVFKHLVTIRKPQISIPKFYKLSNEIDKHLRKECNTMVIVDQHSLSAVLQDYDNIFNTVHSCNLNQEVILTLADGVLKDVDGILSKLDKYFIHGIPLDIYDVILEILMKEIPLTESRDWKDCTSKVEFEYISRGQVYTSDPVVNFVFGRNSSDIAELSNIGIRENVEKRQNKSVRKVGEVDFLEFEVKFKFQNKSYLATCCYLDYDGVDGYGINTTDATVHYFKNTDRQERVLQAIVRNIILNYIQHCKYKNQGFEDELPDASSDLDIGFGKFTRASISSV